MKKGHDYSTLLIWAALAVTVTRYIGAFVASDVGKISGNWSVALTALMAISGIGMGFLDVLGLAYVFDGWRKALPQAGHKWSSRFWVLTIFVIGLFVVGLGILTPFTVARIREVGMAEVLIHADWWWALAVNLAPILIIGGVTFSQSNFVTIRTDTQVETKIVQESKGNNVQKVSESVEIFPTRYSVDWRKLPHEDKNIVANLTIPEIMTKYRVSEKTAYNWRSYTNGKKNGSTSKIENA